VEQSLGTKQSLLIGYVASQGLKLSTLRWYSYSAAVSPLVSEIYQYENGPGSTYNSLQTQYKRQMAQGLQAIVSYTWSHAIDSASSDLFTATMPLQKGNGDEDVRHNFTAAAVYNLPSSYNNRFKQAVLGYWNADLWFVARSAFPYEVSGPSITNPATGQLTYEALNYNGLYPYVKKSSIPGGRQINPAVFSVPLASANGVGDAPRNFLRSFGEAQANLAIQRNFPLYERLNLQFRAEAFNFTNHPNFGGVSTTCGSSTAGQACNNVLMGQATSTLSASLGGLSSLYQQGGPRSLQFMLKLHF